MHTTRDLFIHELSDMLDAEQKLVDALAEGEEQATRPELKKAFSAHRAQTENHVQRIEDVFQELGLEPEAHECKGITGLIEERESFLEEDPSPEILDVFSAGAAVKVERYEISSYEGLTRMARDLGLKQAARLLGQSLAEEEATLKKMQTLEKKLKPSASGLKSGGAGREERAPARRAPQARPGRHTAA